MAMAPVGGGSKRPARLGAPRYRAMSDINVTPMVDVMLVLLVVFMITAPLLSAGVPVDLPKTETAQLTGQDEPLVVTVDAKGKAYLQDNPIDDEALGPRLEAITSNRKDARIFVRGDRTLAYGRIMEVMGIVSRAGFTKVALVAEIPSEPPRPARARR